MGSRGPTLVPDRGQQSQCDQLPIGPGDNGLSAATLPVATTITTITVFTLSKFMFSLKDHRTTVVGRSPPPVYLREVRLANTLKIKKTSWQALCWPRNRGWENQRYYLHEENVCEVTTDKVLCSWYVQQYKYRRMHLFIMPCFWVVTGDIITNNFKFK